MRRKSTLDVGMDVHKESIVYRRCRGNGRGASPRSDRRGRKWARARGAQLESQGYDVKANGTTLDAFSIALDAKAAWEGYLRSKGSPVSIRHTGVHVRVEVR